MNKLKENYEKACNDYIKEFCKKQEIEYNEETAYWINGCIGELIDINAYSFTFVDVKYDIDTNQPKGLIFQWYDSGLMGLINYETFTKTYKNPL